MGKTAPVVAVAHVAAAVFVAPVTSLAVNVAGDFDVAIVLFRDGHTLEVFSLAIHKKIKFFVVFFFTLH